MFSRAPPPPPLTRQPPFTRLSLSLPLSSEEFPSSCHLMIAKVSFAPTPLSSKMKERVCTSRYPRVFGAGGARLVTCRVPFALQEYGNVRFIPIFWRIAPFLSLGPILPERSFGQGYCPGRSPTSLSPVFACSIPSSPFFPHSPPWPLFPLPLVARASLAHPYLLKTSFSPTPLVSVPPLCLPETSRDLSRVLASIQCHPQTPFFLLSASGSVQKF